MSTLSELAADPRLGAARIHVVDASDEHVVFDLSGELPSPTASVMKVLTSAAALEILGPDRRAITRLVASGDPSAVVVVGAGDVTLSRTPTGARTIYPGAAHIDELARRFAETRAEDEPGRHPLQTLVVDVSLFSGPTWEAGWDEQVERIEDGSVSHITALQLDGDREDPCEVYSPRSPDPVAFAGRALASELGASEVRLGRAEPEAITVAEIASPSVRELIEMALPISDNTVMEMLARLTAIESGAGSDFAAIDPAIRRALSVYGPPLEAARIADGSGLSDHNAVPARYVARLMARVWRRELNLGVIADALPVSGSGATGTLAEDRFTGASAVVGDAVHAKTGWIEHAYTLAGYVETRSGRNLAFAVFATGQVGSSAKQAIDGFVAALYREDEIA